MEDEQECRTADIEERESTRLEEERERRENIWELQNPNLLYAKYSAHISGHRANNKTIMECGREATRYTWLHDSRDILKLP